MDLLSRTRPSAQSRQGAICLTSTSPALSLSLGNIDANTGMPNLAGPYDPANRTPTTQPDPDLLLASTFGQGAFAINLAPMLFPSHGSARLQQQYRHRARRHTIWSRRPQPTLRRPQRDHRLRERDPDHDRRRDPGRRNFRQGHRRVRPAKRGRAPTVAANWTDAFGNFSIQVNAGAFTSNGLKTVKIYRHRRRGFDRATR